MKTFTYPVKVQIEDVDYGRVVYHANYLNYYERARSEWLASAGFDVHWQMARQVYFVVASVALEYKRPARLADELLVTCTVDPLRKVSATFDQTIALANEPSILLNKASIKIVCVDDNLKPRGIPTEIMDMFLG